MFLLKAYYAKANGVGGKGNRWFRLLLVVGRGRIIEKRVTDQHLRMGIICTPPLPSTIFFFRQFVAVVARSLLPNLDRGSFCKVVYGVASLFYANSYYNHFKLMD